MCLWKPLKESEKPKNVMWRLHQAHIVLQQPAVSKSVCAFERNHLLLFVRFLLVLLKKSLGVILCFSNSILRNLVIYFSKSFRLIESLLSKFFFSSIVRRVKFPEYVWT